MSTPFRHSQSFIPFEILTIVETFKSPSTLDKWTVDVVKTDNQSENENTIIHSKYFKITNK